MKLKQCLSMLLSLAILLSILCGCENDRSTLLDNCLKDEHESIPSASVVTPTIPNDTFPDTSNPASPQLVEMKYIQNATEFSEGLAFVEWKKGLHCINKKGEILFSLDNEEYSPCGSFHLGHAFVYSYDEEGIFQAFICNTEGNLTSASDLGATSFVRTPYEYDNFFFGDYIIVEKVTATPDGNLYEMGILNSNLEYVAGPSADLYNRCYFLCEQDNTICYDNYLFSTEDMSSSKMYYLDLRTGLWDYNRDKVFSSINLMYESDFWYKVNNVTYVDRRDNNLKVYLMGYETSILYSGEYEYGTAPLVLTAETTEGIKTFFTIMNEVGEFIFEPIEVNVNDFYVDRDKDNIILANKIETDENFVLELTLFNYEGLSAKYTFTSDWNTSVSINDCVIVFGHTFNQGWYFYDLNFNLLF